MGRTCAVLGTAAAMLASAGNAAASPRQANSHPTGGQPSLLEQFDAACVGQGVLLRWVPAPEAKTVGYNVYRQVKKQRVRVNDSLIPAAPEVRGHAYRWLDRTSNHRARYWLEIVFRDGTRACRGQSVAS